jgi:GrpB-like predicted nucleotidyltransferase (UPF0157 family)
MRIEIVPANPDWPNRFAQLRDLLLYVAPKNEAIHHIGSTAVPGLVAKDIIDIQVTVVRLSNLDQSAMRGAGFELRPPVCDHAPAGMNLPEIELGKLLFRIRTPIAANVHVREQGRFNQRYPLLCRDYLRSNPLVAAAYGTIKQHLAAQFPEDNKGYYGIKNPVFEIIRAAAEDWAAFTGWTSPHSD